jgi:signal transduction histidine kinase
LAIAINKLELLIETGNLQNEQAEDIAEIMNIIERLVRLNKSLLLLTKIENKQFLESKLVSFNEVVKQNVNDLEEITAFKSVKIVVEEKVELAIQMDISLANIVISNLLRNAIFHNVSGGIVNIKIKDKKIQIENTGLNIPLNAQKVFSRFYKSDTNPQGTGLGLAIAKAICDLYEISILYHFENSLHCFELRFK